MDKIIISSWQNSKNCFPVDENAVQVLLPANDMQNIGLTISIIES